MLGRKKITTAQAAPATEAPLPAHLRAYVNKVKGQDETASNAPLFVAGRSHTSAEGAKNGYIFLVAAIAPFLLAAILALGVGYFFAGFQPFSWSIPGMLAYGGGFTVEAVCLACFFASAKAFWGGQRWHFVAAMMAALALSTISISSQVLYLVLDGLKGAGNIPPGALDNIPILGWLVGSNGAGWVILARAIGFHVAEAACCFVLAKSTDSPEKRIAAMQREQRAALELARFEHLAAMERRIFEYAFRAFERAEQAMAIDAPPALPPGEGEGELRPFRLDTPPATNGNGHKRNGKA